MNQLFSLEAEQSVLGTLLVDESQKEIIFDLQESYFTDDIHKVIYNAIRRLIDRDAKVDMVAVVEESRNMGHEVPFTSLTDIMTFSIPATVRQHIKILKEKQQKRIIYDLLNEAIFELTNGTEEIEGFRATLASKLDSAGAKDTQTIADDPKSLAMKILRDLENKQSKEELDKYSYGIKELDSLMVGLHKEEVTTIAAKSGVGKTAFALQIGKRLASKGLKVLFISREMSDVQMGKRIIANLTGINSNKLRTKDFNEKEWVEITKALNYISSKLNIYINTECNTISKIKNRLRQIKADVLIVDYLQLITPEKSEGSREREVATISRALKNISLDFKIPVIQLSQLNDEMRDSRPKGERVMRESKAIYQDSNNVIYLYEPTGTELEKIIEDERNPITAGIVSKFKERNIKLIEVIVDKQRDGATGSFLQYYISERLTFMGVER